MLVVVTVEVHGIAARQAGATNASCLLLKNGIMILRWKQIEHYASHEMRAGTKHYDCEVCAKQPKRIVSQSLGVQSHKHEESSRLRPRSDMIIEHIMSLHHAHHDYLMLLLQRKN